MAQRGRKRFEQNYFPGRRWAKRNRGSSPVDGSRATRAHPRLTHLHAACLAGPWRCCVNNKRAMSLTSMSSVERVGKEYLVLFWAYPEPHPLNWETLTCPVSAAGSKGRRNTCAQFTRRSLKAQSFSWALI